MLKEQAQGMVFSCGCLAIMTLCIITDSMNSWSKRAPLINRELINCAAYTGSVMQNPLDLCSAAGWRCITCLIPGSFSQDSPSKLVLKGEVRRLPTLALVLWQTSAVSFSHSSFLSPPWRRWKQALGQVLEYWKYRGLLQQWFWSSALCRAAQEIRIWWDNKVTLISSHLDFVKDFWFFF